MQESNPRTNTNKMLLMGNSGVGKTSMHSVIFANYPVKDTANLGYTVNKAQYKFKFMGNLTLNMIDCGAQKQFMAQYFTTQKQTLFQGIQVLIYVFDIQQDQKDYIQSIGYFKNTMLNLSQYSPQANLFILIHKMDKIKDQTQKSIKFQAKQKAILEQFQPYRNKINLRAVFGTSIWDETLYEAWSQIVQMLIPELEFVRNHLTNFCKLSGCDEAVLFERSTFLIITFFDSKEKHDLMRYEKVSNIIKKFKLTCTKIGATLDNVVVTAPKFTAVIEEYTPNINIMLIFTDPEIKIQSIIDNVKIAGGVFDKTMLKKARNSDSM